MNEEEKKAIEYLKAKIEINKIKIKSIEEKGDKSLMGLGTMHDVYKLQNLNYILLLNLIEKQDKIIDKQTNNNKDLLRKLRNRVKEVKQLSKYSLYKKEFSTLNKQIKDKDKIIDLMSEFIFETTDYEEEKIYDFKDKDEVKEYFRKMVEE